MVDYGILGVNDYISFLDFYSMWKVLTTEVLLFLTVAGFIVLGALAHAFNALKTHKDAGLEFTWQDFFILAFLAVFTGMLFGLLTFTFLSENVYIVTLFSGVGSFSGIVGLNKITAMALDVIKYVLTNKN